MPIRDLCSGHDQLYSRFVRALMPDHVVVVGHRLGSLAASIAVDMRENGQGCLSLVPGSGSRFTGLKSLLIKSIRVCEVPDKVIQKHFKSPQVEEIITRYNCSMERFIEEFKRFKLPGIDMAIVDGDRPSRVVQFDFVCILANSRRNSIIFLHKSNSAMRKFLLPAYPLSWLGKMQGKEAWFEAVELPPPSNETLVRVLQN